MKVFLDANVLVATLNKEYPVFSHSSRLLSLPNSRFQLYTSSLCLAISFYFSSKKSGEKLARQKIATLVDHIHIASISEEAVKQAIENTSIHDLEDGFQYYAALQAGCSHIVTEDTGDFYFADISISVTNCQSFLQEHVF